LIYGDDYFGKVDHVPGLFFVKTRFLHCMWVPLVPRESYLMVDGEACPPIQIRLRWKSVWVAWLRSFLFVMALWLVTTGFMVLIARGAESRAIVIAIIVWIISVFFAGLWYFSHRFTRAKIDRALELGKLLGLPQDEIEIRFDPKFQQVTHSPQTSEPSNPDVSAPSSIEEITSDVGEGLRNKVTASRDAVKDAAIPYLYLAITLVVLLPIACVGLVTGVGVLMIAKEIVGESAVAVWGTVTVLGLLIPAICVCNSNRLLPKPTYFGESRGFLLAVISSSWLVGVICSAV
jgi:hypothetical protein